MRQDPGPRSLPDPPEQPGAVPERPSRIIHNLGVDQIAVEVISALRARGVGVILLKGPSIARWIYEPGDRSYLDVDLLIRPQDLMLTAEVLRDLGFSSSAPPDLPWDRPAYQEWSRPQGPEVDIHPTLNLLEQLPPQDVWDVLAETPEHMELLGTTITVLTPPARALHVALHAHAHGAGSPQAQNDLRRALAVLPPETWASAAEVADRLGALPVLAAALRSVPEGVEKADELGLADDRSTSLEIRRRARSEGERWAALGVDWWLRQSLSVKAGLLLKKMFPSASYLKARSRLAAKGGAWLVVAYVARPFVVLGWGARGAIRLLDSKRAKP